MPNTDITRFIPNKNIVDLIKSDASSLISELPNSNPLLIKFNSQEEGFQAVLNNPQVFTNYQSRKNAVNSKNWRLEQREADKKIYEDVKQWLETWDMDNDGDMISDIPFRGRAHITYDIIKENNKWIPTNYRDLSLDYFEYDENNNLFILDANGRKTKIEEEHQILTFTYMPRYSPYGFSVLGACMWDAIFLKNLQEWALKFAEKYGMPWIKGEFDIQELSKQLGIEGEIEMQVADSTMYKLRDQLQQAIKDYMMVFPKGMDVSAISPGSSQNIQIFTEMIKVSQQNINKVMLGFSNASDATPGQLGNSNKSTTLTVRNDIIRSDCKLKEYAVNTRIKQYVGINYGYDKPTPSFIIFDKPTTDELSDKADLFVKLNQIGYRLTKEGIIKNFNISENEIEAIQNTPTKPSSVKLAVPNSNIRMADDEEKSDDIMDELIDLENYVLDSKEWKEAYDEPHKQIINLIKNAKNEKELKAMLSDDFFNEMDTRKKEEVLHRLNMTVEMFGAISEEDE